MRSGRTWAICGGAAVLALFSVFVWPTQYRYHEIRGGRETLPVRENRFTGRVDMLYPSTGWEEVKPPAPAKPVDPKDPLGILK